MKFRDTHFKLNFIYEMPVYDGYSKEWRVLNLNTGSVYSLTYENEIDALNSIRNGEIRNNILVKAITLDDLKCNYLFE